MFFILLVKIVPTDFAWCDWKEAILMISFISLQILWELSHNVMENWFQISRWNFYIDTCTNLTYRIRTACSRTILYPSTIYTVSSSSTAKWFCDIFSSSDIRIAIFWISKIAVTEREMELFNNFIAIFSLLCVLYVFSLAALCSLDAEAWWSSIFFQTLKQMLKLRRYTYTRPQQRTFNIGGQPVGIQHEG